MNERIEQLYKEAVNSASAELHEWNKNWQPGKHTNFEYEKVLYKKFAELIVQECVNVLHDNELWNRHISHALKEHFGVEE
jgi:hypothetical protein